MVQNWNLSNYSHHRILKYIGFMSSHYISAINLNAMLLFSIFNEFDFVSR